MNEQSELSLDSLTADIALELIRAGHVSPWAGPSPSLTTGDVAGPTTPAEVDKRIKEWAHASRAMAKQIIGVCEADSRSTENEVDDPDEKPGKVPEKREATQEELDKGKARVRIQRNPASK